MSIPTAISGATRLFGIVGDPVEQARAPALFNAHFAERGIDAVFVGFHVRAEDVAGAMAGFRSLRNLGGVVITVPHKFAFAGLIDEIGESGRMVGAVNVIRRLEDGRWTGDLFDGIGFVEGIRAEGIDPAGKSVLIVGAGGAGSAIAGALTGAGVGRLTIVDIVPEKAELLCRKLAAAGPGVAVVAGGARPHPTGFDIVVNATPLGMKADDPLPVDPGRLSPATVVADAIMKPPVTRLLKEAGRRGCRIHPGRHMMDHQFPLFARFFGIDGPARGRPGGPA